MAGLSTPAAIVLVAQRLKAKYPLFQCGGPRSAKGSCMAYGPVDPRTDTVYGQEVIQSVRHRGLKRLYEREDKSGVRADQLRRIRDVLAHLDSATKPSDLDFPGYRLHPLKGEFRGFWSVTISGNWRIVFRFEDGAALDVDLTDYH